LAASKRPSYLKRQKEQQRFAKAAQKREARLSRKHSKGGGPPIVELDEYGLPMESAEDHAAEMELDEAAQAEDDETEQVQAKG
jgi:hypothetical protein